MQRSMKLAFVAISVGAAFAAYSFADHWGRSDRSTISRAGHGDARTTKVAANNVADRAHDRDLPYGNIRCGQHGAVWLIPEAHACVSFNIPKGQYRKEMDKARAGNVSSMQDLHLYYGGATKRYPEFQKYEHGDLHNYWTLIAGLSGDSKHVDGATSRLLKIVEKMNDKDEHKLNLLRNIVSMRSNAGMNSKLPQEDLAAEIKRLEALHPKAKSGN